MIGIIDYGVGNLYSVSCSLDAIGQQNIIVTDPSMLSRCDRLILPGVGAFGDAAIALKKSGMFDPLIREAQNGTPLLGICLGMQLLFEKSREFGEHEGLGLIPGEIVPIKPIVGDNKVPHIGWNALSLSEPKSKLYKYLSEGDHVYFVHSFHGECDKKYISATTDYGAVITASVENKNVYGTQFHPEKSGNVGLSILRAFCEI